MIKDTPKIYTWAEMLPRIKEAYEEVLGTSPSPDFPDCVLVCYAVRFIHTPTVSALANAVVEMCAKRLVLHGTPQVKRDDPVAFAAYMQQSSIDGITRTAKRSQERADAKRKRATRKA